MGLLRICLLTVVVWASLFRGTSAYCSGKSCGCIFYDYGDIDKKDIVSEVPRTVEFQHFIYGLYLALNSNWQAYVFAKSSKHVPPMIPDVGKSLCDTTKKNVLGFFRDNGNTLCWIVAPDIYMAECCGETCCGANTRCEPTLHLDRKFLIYCDSYYDGGKQPAMTALATTDVTDFDPEVLFNIDDFDGSGDGSGDEPIEARRKRSYKRGYGYGYFAYRHDRFPLICTCRTCDC